LLDSLLQEIIRVLSNNKSSPSNTFLSYVSMPPQTKPQSAGQPNENISFSQFFTNLLIKVPQVDIERLPVHLVHGYETAQEDVEMEADIYSMEHQDNVEEFKTKDIVGKFLTPLKTDKILSCGTDPLDADINISEMEEAITDDADADSITCTVEENDLNCPQEDMLDLTITDEFTDECAREKCPLDFNEREEKNKPICCARNTGNRNPEKELEIPYVEKSKDLSCAFDTESGRNGEGRELMQSLNIHINKENTSEREISKNVFPEDKTSENSEQSNKQNTDKLESPKVDEVSCKELKLKKCSVENINLELNFQTSFTDKNIDCETHGVQTGVDQIYTKSMQLTNEKQNDHDSGSVSSDLSMAHETSGKVNIGTIKTLNRCENYKSQTKEDSNHFIENQNVENKIILALTSKEGFKSEMNKPSNDVMKINDPVNENKVKETQLFNSHIETKMNAPVLADVVLPNCEGCLDTEKCKDSPDKDEFKNFNKGEELNNEPPALKIRIFKGNSGELINEKEAKRMRKRKRKIKKEKVKFLKQAAVENDTQTRIIQELPRCNWLEQKIKYGESSKPLSSHSEIASYSHVDELLETDSDDDYLVVDDEHTKEDNEVTTNFKEVSLGQNENVEKMEKPLHESLTLPPIENAPKIYTNIEKNMASCETKLKLQVQVKTVQDVNKSNKDSENNDQKKHPITYMLNNLMKKMDDNKTTNISKVSLLKEKTVQDQEKFKNKAANLMLEKENNMKKYLNHVTENRQAAPVPFEEVVEDYVGCKNTCNPMEMESNTNHRQPEEMYQDSLKTTKEDSEQESNERILKESKQKALNLHFHQQMIENTRIEDKLIKDIEELKNKKIKEMEDLIDIKSKKEQSMTDLEKLKIEIMKNKTFLESLKKINLTEELQSKQTHACNDVVIQTESNNINTEFELQATPKILKKKQQVQVKHLPDLVNHERVVPKQMTPDNLQSLNLSQDYINQLQRIKDSNNKSELESTLKHYHNNLSTNQIKTPAMCGNQNNQAKFSESVQATTFTHSRPGLSIHNVQNTTQQQPVPQLLMKSPTMQDKYGTNVHQFFPVSDKNTREINQIQTIQPPQQVVGRPSSVPTVASRDGMQIRQAQGRREGGENKAVPSLLEGSFLRTKEFSRGDPQIDESQFVNNTNNQYEIRNFLQTHPQTQEPNQPRQGSPANNNFPEIRNAIAATTDRREQQPPVRNAMQAQKSQTQQNKTSGTLSKCIVCYKVANFLCSGCQCVYYCTVQCQSNHWLSHYTQCVRGPRH